MRSLNQIIIIQIICLIVVSVIGIVEAFSLKKLMLNRLNRINYIYNNNAKGQDLDEFEPVLLVDVSDNNNNYDENNNVVDLEINKSKTTPILVSEYLESIQRNKKISKNSFVNSLNNIGLEIIKNSQFPRSKDEAWR